MRLYKQAGFLPQWSIICIGKYTYICPTWEFYFLMAYTRAYYIYIYIHVHDVDCHCYGYCDFVNFPSPVWIGQMRVVILLAFSLSAMSRRRRRRLAISIAIYGIGICIYICVACIYICGMRHCLIAGAIAFSWKLPASGGGRIFIEK